MFIIENEAYKFAEQEQLDWLDNFLCDPIVDNDAKQQLQALIDTVGSQHFNALNTLLLVTIIAGAGFATVAMMINLGLLTGPFIAFLVLSILPITILESSIVATPFACILLMCNLLKVELEKSTERTALKFFDIPASKPDTKVTQEEISQEDAFFPISISL